MTVYPQLGIRELPKPPHWTRAVGVGIVVMGLAMGTGELILWPHLVTKYGLGLLWLALVGITCQYFINQEVARHTLATGESFFTTSARILKWIPIFWLLSAILLYIWPGWASSIGTTLTELSGFGDYKSWAWATLALVLALTFSGKRAYGLLEKSLKIIVPIFFLILLGISYVNLTPEILREAGLGLINFGYIPKGIDMNVLLGAVVFAGAGGMLNLCISLWYRDKGNGMAHYAGRITNPITGKTEAVSPIGHTFENTPENMQNWRGWMRYVRIDQGLVFWLLGLLTLILLSVNAYAVLTPKGLIPEGMQVAVVQAHIFGDVWGPVGFKLFLVMAFLMLFSVMWTVIDALARILSDIIYTNTHLAHPESLFRHIKKYSLSHMYYAIVVLVVLAGAFLIPLQQPFVWLTISGVLGGLTMAIYTPMLIYINNTKLPKPLRPGIITNTAMTLIAIFFLFFAYTAIDNAWNKINLSHKTISVSTSVFS